MYAVEGVGAEAVSDLVLLVTGPSRRRRGWLSCPCLRCVGHGPNAYLQALKVPTSTFTPAAIEEGGGARREPHAAYAYRDGATTGMDTHRKKTSN